MKEANEQKCLTLGAIIPLVAAGAMSIATAAPAVSKPTVAVFPSGPTVFHKCTMGSNIALKANTPSPDVLVNVWISGKSFSAGKRWEVFITQSSSPVPLFKPSFTATKQTRFGGLLRVEVVTEKIGGPNRFKATAWNLHRRVLLQPVGLGVVTRLC
jgi:hypothetical protein